MKKSGGAGGAADDLPVATAVPISSASPYPGSGPIYQQPYQNTTVGYPGAAPQHHHVQYQQQQFPQQYPQYPQQPQREAQVPVQYQVMQVIPTRHPALLYYLPLTSLAMQGNASFQQPYYGHPAGQPVMGQVRWPAAQISYMCARLFLINQPFPRQPGRLR